MKYALTALLLLPSIALAELPVISDARIVQPPPGTPVAGGFFTVTNPGDEDLVLTSVSSEDIAKVELHLSAVIDDVATMKEQDEIVIPAGQTLCCPLQSGHAGCDATEPGGLRHLQCVFYTRVKTASTSRLSGRCAMRVYCRPRVSTTHCWTFWVEMARQPSDWATAASLPCTCRRGTITACTCRRPVNCSRKLMYPGACGV